MAATTAKRKGNQFATEFNEAMVSVGEKFGLYNAIGEIGPASESRIAGYLGISRERVGDWLSEQAAAGYLYRDAEGRYSVSCPLSERHN